MRFFFTASPAFSEFLTGSALLNYQTTESKTDASKASSQTMSQNYYLTWDKPVSSTLRYRLGIRYFDTETRTKVNGSYTESSSEVIEPTFEVNLRNPLYDLIGGYRQTESSFKVGPTRRETTDGFLFTRLAWRPEGFPFLSLNLDRRRSYDHFTPRQTDFTETRLFLGSHYGWGPLRFLYNFNGRRYEDQVNQITRDILQNMGNLGFSETFWKGKAWSSGSYQVSHTMEEERVARAVRVIEQRTAVNGLVGIDTTPSSGSLASASALKDGDRGTAAGTTGEYNLGGTTLGGGTDRNLGLDLGSRKKVNRIYIYFSSGFIPTPAFSPAFTWAVYSSEDNSIWTLITSSASFSYNAIERRFEIIFTETEARYFKAVNLTHNAGEPSAAYVSEVEAYGEELKEKTRETTTLINTMNLNLGAKPLKATTFYLFL